MSRDKLLGLLWGEGDPDKSRHALTQSLYHIRKALGGERLFIGASDLRVDESLLTSDVADFQAALADRRFSDAVDLYRGPFLDGFHLSGNAEFDFWVSAERDRYSRQLSTALATLADDASKANAPAVELQWRERQANHDPFDGGVIARYMRALMAAGDHSTALQRARNYKSRLREELDLPPDRAVVELVTELRRTAQVKARAVESTPVDEAAAPPVAEIPAPAEAPARPEAVTPPARTRSWRTAAWISAAAVAAFAAITTRVAASRAATARTLARETTIMVAPFSVASSEPASAYLREGLVDLLASRLTEPDAKRATEPSRVLQAWKLAGYSSDSLVSVEAAARIARSLDAGEVVIGSVVATNAGGGVKIHASLVDATNSRVKADVDISGSADSLMALTDRLVNGLILTEAGERVGSLAQAPVAPAALRAFLAGRAAYRRDDYYGAMRAFEQALAHEPNFARAALGLAMAADRVNSAEQHDRGLAVAWARQNDLPPGDREYLRAFAGPRYPEPSSASESLDAWERAVRVAPDRPEGWHALGESFYYDAEVLGLHDGPVRAAEAFERALKLDPSYAPSRRMLTLLVARDGDTARLRTLFAAGRRDPDDSMNIFVRWRAAHALRDDRELERVRRGLDNAPSAALRSIAMTSQFDGVSIDDGDRALAILRRRALSDAEEIDLALANHSRALNSADVPRAFSITEELGRRQPALHPQLRLRVLDGLYSNADKNGAAAAATRLESFVATAPLMTPADSAVRQADVCVVGQWRLSQHDTTGARAAIRALRAVGTPRFPVPLGANPLACAELIDVSLAVIERGVGARERLAHLDSLMLSGPAVGDAMRYANLLVARHYQALGDPAHALAALRRRSYMRGWPRYRATGLQLQVDLALQLGDSAAARAAYQRLMTTRRPPLVAEATPQSTRFVSRLRRLSRRLVN